MLFALKTESPSHEFFPKSSSTVNGCPIHPVIQPARCIPHRTIPNCCIRKCCIVQRDCKIGNLHSVSFLRFNSFQCFISLFAI